MRNGQLVTEVLKFAVSERKKREPHTRFSFVCAIPALCFIVSHFPAGIYRIRPARASARLLLVLRQDKRIDQFPDLLSSLLGLR